MLDYGVRSATTQGGVSGLSDVRIAAPGGSVLALVKDTITEKLTSAFSPLRLDVIDDSGRHQGHAGARLEGETHFKVHIVSDVFSGQTLIARHRMVNEALADELSGPVHALNIQAVTPGEAGGGQA